VPFGASGENGNTSLLATKLGGHLFPAGKLELGGPVGRVGTE